MRAPTLQIVLILVVLFFTHSSNSQKTFWHFTDIHWNPNYEIGAAAECKKTLHINCCQNDSIVKDGSSVRAGLFGSYECDSPVQLVESSLKYMSANPGSAPFIIWTGDDTPHNVLTTDSSGTLPNIFETSMRVKAAFQGIQVFPALGNHDFFPVSRWREPPYCNWLLQNVSTWWGDWLTSDAMQTFLIGGYYTMVVEDGLRLISLNTNFYDHYDPYARVLTDKDDPAGQLAWLNTTLYQAQLANEQVWIIGHVSPGFRSNTGTLDVVEMFETRYTDLVLQYNNTIAAQFFGHWHRDEMKIFRNNDVPAAVLYMSSSVTPWQDVNPSMRLFSYEQGTGNIVDYSVYYLNLSKANETAQDDWEFEYSAREYFNLTDLSAASWYSLANELWQNETAFQDYYDVHTVKSGRIACTSRKCRRRAYCAMIHFDKLAYDGCMLESQPDIDDGDDRFDIFEFE